MQHCHVTAVQRQSKDLWFKHCCLETQAYVTHLEPRPNSPSCAPAVSLQGGSLSWRLSGFTSSTGVILSALKNLTPSSPASLSPSQLDLSPASSPPPPSPPPDSVSPSFPSPPALLDLGLLHELVAPVLGLVKEDNSLVSRHCRHGSRHPQASC